MRSSKVSSLALFSLLSLAATACSVQLGAAADKPAGTAPGSGPAAGAGAEAAGAVDPNAAITEVLVVGTSTASTFKADGSLGITILPKDAAHALVFGASLKATVTFASPTGLVVDGIQTSCSAAAATDAAAIGVIIDDSLSMVDSDPQKVRKTATVSFINSLGAKDKAALTDYGNDPACRDLTCSDAKTGAYCADPTPTFTSDKAALIAATDQIIEGPAGTPLYESCETMVRYVNGVDGRHGMLLLSDGQPTSMDRRAACLTAAKSANIPVFTVGVGPAAEADPKTDTKAVSVLRELASETGGAYASANDPKQLDSLFANMGTALTQGHCTTSLRVRAPAPIAAGTTLTGEITVGSNGAKATFSLVVPQG
jgi:hypothetical protein